jgi:NAD(P)-dependent dehydrogenase (short-subunit alcohol dehydrogenase family)
MYACAKGGTIQLTRTLATSLGRYGVSSNCIVPGIFLTEGTAASRETLPRPEFVPAGRVGDPKELGPVAVFLASAASDYMNGELFIIDGGGLAGGYAPTGYSPAIPLQL